MNEDNIQDKSQNKSQDKNQVKNNEGITTTARWLYMTIAYLSLTVGLIGAFLPIMPTVPFLIVATWAATKGSPKLHHWLYTHKTFGPRLRAWDEHRAIEPQAKWMACIFMTGSWLIMLYMTSGWIIPAITAALFLSIGGYIITRPVPPASE